MSAFKAIPDSSTTTPALRLLDVLAKLGVGDPSISSERQAQGLEGLLTPAEIADLLDRDKVHRAILEKIKEEAQLNMAAVARDCGVGRELVHRVWRAVCDQYPPVQPSVDSLTIGIPKETRARDMVVDILAAGGFRLQGETIVDIQNGLDPIKVRSGFRQQDLLTLAKEGLVHAVIMGSDKAEEILARQAVQGSAVLEVEQWGRFQPNAFRLCIAVPKSVAKEDDFVLERVLQGARLATSYPYTAKRLFQEWGIASAEILRMGGNVEAAPAALRVNAVLDIIETGGSLGRNGLVSVVEIPCGTDLLTLREARLSGPQRSLLQGFATRLKEGEGPGAG